MSSSLRSSEVTPYDVESSVHDRGSATESIGRQGEASHGAPAQLKIIIPTKTLPSLAVSTDETAQDIPSTSIPPVRIDAPQRQQLDARVHPPESDSTGSAIALSPSTISYNDNNIPDSDSLLHYHSPSSPPLSTTGMTTISSTLRRLKAGTSSLESNRDFWMKDSLCRECYLCGLPFTVMRRKHHCRICGQIFCGKCTMMVAGERLRQGRGVRGLRVCGSCVKIMDEIEDMEEEEEVGVGDDQVSMLSEGDSTMMPSPPDARPGSHFFMPHGPTSTPLMAIPIKRTRTASANGGQESRSRPAVEISALPIIRSGTEKDFNPRLNFGRTPSGNTNTFNLLLSSSSSRQRTPAAALPGAASDDHLSSSLTTPAPFRRAMTQDTLNPPGFGDILDPEYAYGGSAFISDEEGSEDEGDPAVSLFATLAPRRLKGLETPGTGTGSSGASVHSRSRDRLGGGTGALHPRDTGSSQGGRSRRHSFSGVSRSTQRPRSRNFLRQLTKEGTSKSYLGGPSITASPGYSGRTSRAASVQQGSPAVELNSASLQHVQDLLRQLLEDSNIPGVERWQNALMPVLLKVADSLQPDLRSDDAIDIRHYVKIKRIPGGRPSDTSYISGVVFTKNLALKKMARSISYPRIVILTFPVEYHRAELSFMSLDPVIAQEKEFLRNLVNRVIALRPNLVLIEGSVSGLALQFLADAGIAVAYNVKPSAIAAVARCTQTDIISSIDRLVLDPKVGRCANFNVKTFVHDDIPGKRKSFLYFEGCPKELGCTIVLRGADMATLSKLKFITEFIAFVVYNLKLETCLMRDEFALIPTAPPSRETSATTVTISIDENIGDLPLSSKHLDDTLDTYKKKILSASPFVKFLPPYLLSRAHDALRRLSQPTEAFEKPPKSSDLTNEQEGSDSEKVDEAEPHTSVVLRNPNLQTRIDEILMKELHRKTLREYETKLRQWEAHVAQNTDIINPLAHQNIVVLFSRVNSATAVPCEGPKIDVVEFYRGSDRTLGQYIEEMCFNYRSTCKAATCGKSYMEHYKSYVHGRARISVVLDSFSCPLPGLQNSILMWSFCKICKKTTPVIPMSDDTWKYSFGKYLEISFYSSRISCRAGFCPHDVNRDHVRYFGFQNLAVRFQHDDIDLYEIAPPKMKVFWKPDITVKLREQEYLIIQAKIDRFYTSLEARIKSITQEGIVPDKVELCKSELSKMVTRLKEERESLAQELRQVYEGPDLLEILPLNRIMRMAQDLVVQWDMDFAELERVCFPSEKDIRRLTALQLKKLFIDRDFSSDNFERGSYTGAETELLDMKSPLLEDKKLVEGAPMPVEGTSTPAGSPSMPRPSPGRRSITIHKMSQAHAEAELAGSSRTPDNASAGQSVKSIPPAKPPRSQSSPVIPSITLDDIVAARAKLAPLSSQTPPAEVEGKSVLLEPPASGAPSGSASIASDKEGAGRTSKIPGDLPETEGKTTLQKRRTPSISHIPLPIRKDAHIPLDGPIKPSERPEGSRVSSLARHFNRLSMELERDRTREHRLAMARRNRAHPVASSKPIVEVFSSVREAVDELSDEEIDEDHPRLTASEAHQSSPAAPGNVGNSKDPGLDEETGRSTEQAEGSAGKHRDDDPHEDQCTESSVPKSDGLSTSANSFKFENDVPGHGAERMSIIKTLTNLWTDRSSTWSPLEYPLNPSEHIFTDSDVIVREDEPSSLIAFTLSSMDYRTKLSDMQRMAGGYPSSPEVGTSPPDTVHTPDQAEIESAMLRSTGTHMKYQFQEGSAKLFCKIFYAEQFDAFRRICHCQDKYIESLARCVKWDSSGGKSGSAFLKTLDDRLVVKQMSRLETDAFIKFAPSYFEYMSKALFHELPTVLAKIFGFYQIGSRNPLTGKTMKMDVLVMENLFYDRKTSRIFDLKGSMRNRHVHATGKENEVLLDENLVEFIYESPLFVREHAKKFLRASLWNDTLFLAKMNVMDYSLVIGIDDDRKELVVGIIDCIRTFTWDKKLESWVKERGLVGGGGKEPTVVTPKQYKNRFREAMEQYILMVPSCWFTGNTTLNHTSLRLERPNEVE
ncbi:Mitochondrial distribution and morphology protein 12 [Saitoella coloradoensis]